MPFESADDTLVATAGHEQSPFEQGVLSAFSANGALSQAMPGYAPRESQLSMARAVAAAFEARSSLMVEAGTGVGKSFAYLVPALLHGGKVLVSTATKTLQDQLFVKDIPFVRKALGISVDVALLKGRANYVCHYRTKRAAEEARFGTREAAEHLRRVMWLMDTSATGDRAELADVPEDSGVWPFVTSSKDNCLGTDCPDYGACFVMKARRRAMAADVVVVNHHLFFADMMLRDEGMGEILPSADAVVFDEAHQLPDIGLNFSGTQVSTQQWVELARDVQAVGQAKARGLADWAGYAASLHQAVREARLNCGSKLGRYSFEALPPDATSEAIAGMAQSLAPLQKALDQFTELAPEFVRLASRVAELAQACEALQNDESFPLRIVEITSHSARWRASALNLKDTLGKFAEGTKAALIFTSATLSTAGNFSYVSKGLGMQADGELALDSPFQFAEQARLYVPQRFPLPKEPGFEASVVKDVSQLVRANSGGALLLCTSLRSMRGLGEALTAELGDEVRVIVQSDSSKREAVQQLRNAQQKVLLIGSQSFWEGLDMPGDLLTLVMIDKLPFAPPDDPLAKARSDEAEREGGSGFQAVSLPQAAISLKQGAGRLIRTMSDKGVLAIFDRRLVSTGYGRTLVNALPPFKRVGNIEEALVFLTEM
jgi:ATP-dependent DNA helicase DinG